MVKRRFADNQSCWKTANTQKTHLRNAQAKCRSVTPQKCSVIKKRLATPARPTARINTWVTTVTRSSSVLKHIPKSITPHSCCSTALQFVLKSLSPTCSSGYSEATPVLSSLKYPAVLLLLTPQIRYLTPGSHRCSWRDTPLCEHTGVQQAKQGGSRLSPNAPQGNIKVPRTSRMLFLCFLDESKRRCSSL